MNLYQVALQLGIAGLVVAVGYKIALVLIRSWREAEKERTKAIGDGLTAIAGAVQAQAGILQTHATADIKSHGEITDRVSRLEGKLDQALTAERAERRRSRQIVTPHGGTPLRPATDEG